MEQEGTQKDDDVLRVDNSEVRGEIARQKGRPPARAAPPEPRPPKPTNQVDPSRRVQKAYLCQKLSVKSSATIWPTQPPPWTTPTGRGSGPEVPRHALFRGRHDTRSLNQLYDRVVLIIHLLEHTLPYFSFFKLRSLDLTSSTLTLYKAKAANKRCHQCRGNVRECLMCSSMVRKFRTEHGGRQRSGAALMLSRRVPSARSNKNYIIRRTSPASQIGRTRPFALNGAYKSLRLARYSLLIADNLVIREESRSE
ncbi:hypothetical protein EVAR_39440_1 [Eumeta japonica]|uniref:Uncharacterized protein n=1 Tax=Eumeta variegata TaxID=151549 RepID=A0A4C1W1K5_EUMVA|nr:hypothetical protein EVAR_39440_1 [Eumeta japonica]